MEPIVVMASRPDPIDLTASLIGALLDQSTSPIPTRVEWRATVVDPLNLRQMQLLAMNLKGFDVSVLPTDPVVAAREDRYVLQQLESLASRGGALRIVHGALVVEEKSAGSILKCTCLSVLNGRSWVSPSGRDGTWLALDSLRFVGTIGSLHLLSGSVGRRLAHLPWYCLDDGLADLEVDETVSPVAASSVRRLGDARLAPTGYSLLEYAHGEVAAYVTGCLGVERLVALEAWGWLLHKYPTSARKVSPDHSEAVPLVEGRLRWLRDGAPRRCPLAGGPAFVVDKLLWLSLVGRVLERLDRGHGIDDYGRRVLATVGLDAADAAAHRRIETLVAAAVVDAQTVGVLRDSLPRAAPAAAVSSIDPRFGEMARELVQRACALVHTLNVALCVDLKASVPNLVRASGGDVGGALRLLVQERGERPVAGVRGSIAIQIG